MSDPAIRPMLRPSRGATHPLAPFFARPRRLGNRGADYGPSDGERARWRGLIMGTCCSGITSASHADGLGLKSQCVQCNQWECCAARRGRTLGPRGCAPRARARARAHSSWASAHSPWPSARAWTLGGIARARATTMIFFR